MLAVELIHVVHQTERTNLAVEVRFQEGFRLPFLRFLLKIMDYMEFSQTWIDWTHHCLPSSLVSI